MVTISIFPVNIILAYDYLIISYRILFLCMLCLPYWTLLIELTSKCVNGIAVSAMVPPDHKHRVSGKERIQVMEARKGKTQKPQPVWSVQ